MSGGANMSDQDLTTPSPNTCTSMQDFGDLQEDGEHELVHALNPKIAHPFSKLTE
jgi:hypothetical protein